MGSAFDLLWLYFDERATGIDTTRQSGFVVAVASVPLAVVFVYRSSAKCKPGSRTTAVS